MNGARPAAAGRLATAGVSPRVALAAIAGDVAAQLPGVALSDGGRGRWQTVERDRRIRGVTAVAQPDGRYELGPRVAVTWPPGPLAQLGEQLRRRIVAAAEAADLDSRLGEINVAIVSVVDADTRLEANP